MGHRRSRLNIHANRSLIKIEDVKSKRDARYYLGHRVLYIYRAPEKKDPRTAKPILRVIPGKITSTHGNNGTVRVRFSPNLPPRAFGKRVRVMMWYVLYKVFVFNYILLMIDYNIFRPHRAPN